MSNVVTSVPSIHTEGPAAPTLNFSITSSYSWVWNDKGSGALRDCTVWRPQATGGSFIVGYYAEGNHHDSPSPSGSLLVSPDNDDTNNPLLKPPKGWVKVWDTAGSKCASLSIWAPTPPEGYHALGQVAVDNLDDVEPTIPEFRCVRADLLVNTSVGSIIWEDHKSGATNDCTLFSVPWMPNTFLAQGSHAPSYSGNVFRFKKMPPV